jgi:hypothetical protein
MRVAVILMLAMAVSVQADVVANYGADFEADGTPKSGWSYMWNAAGPIGNAAGYVPLVYDTTGVGGYQTQNNGLWPDAAPGSYTRATATTVFPGQSAAQAADGIQRYIILAYTFSPADIATNGNSLKFHTYEFVIPQDTPGNIDVWAFKNNDFLFTFPGGFPPGTTFSDAIFGPDYDFGTVQAGDTLYIALGAQGAYTGQPLSVAYTLALVPEPSALMLIGFAPVLMRRRRL